MKTAISIPDPLFQQAEELAERLGLGRSALYRRALESYLKEYREEEILERINEVCEGVDSCLPVDISGASSTILAGVEWEED